MFNRLNKGIVFCSGITTARKNGGLLWHQREVYVHRFYNIKIKLTPFNAPMSIFSKSVLFFNARGLIFHYPGNYSLNFKTVEKDY